VGTHRETRIFLLHARQGNAVTVMPGPAELAAPYPESGLHFPRVQHQVRTIVNAEMKGLHRHRLAVVAPRIGQWQSGYPIVTFQAQSAFFPGFAHTGSEQIGIAGFYSPARKRQLARPGIAAAPGTPQHQEVAFSIGVHPLHHRDGGIAFTWKKLAFMGIHNGIIAFLLFSWPCALAI